MNASKSLATLDDTAQLAHRLAGILCRGDVVTLSGPVGAGKTTFAQYLIQQLSAEPVEVTSPTFTLLQTYPVTLADGDSVELYHYDLYRIERESALIELGLEDAVAQLVLLEWPEQLGRYPLPVTLALSFALGDDGMRHVAARSHETRFERLIS